MWIWCQEDGVLLNCKMQNVGSLGGYAGRGEGRNSHAHQHVKNIGPIPCGEYTIGKAIDHLKLGPVALPLIPSRFNEMHGRGDFYVHGNNAQNDASEGCIIQDRTVRLMLSQSEDRRLVVIPKWWGLIAKKAA